VVVHDEDALHHVPIVAYRSRSGSGFSLDLRQFGGIFLAVGWIMNA
jgi:hypothetical protein